jgi:hypothetical protein
VELAIVEAFAEDDLPLQAGEYYAQSRMAKLSERAVAQRVNRRLVKQDKRLARARSTRELLAEWYVIDFANNSLPLRNVDLEELARQLGAIDATERL